MHLGAIKFPNGALYNTYNCSQKVAKNKNIDCMSAREKTTKSSINSHFLHSEKKVDCCCCFSFLYFTNSNFQ